MVVRRTSSRTRSAARAKIAQRAKPQSRPSIVAPLASMPEKRRSILGRQLWQAGILSTFIIILSSAVSVFVAQRILEQETLSQIASVATATEDSLVNVLGSARERASLLSAHQAIREALVAGGVSGDVNRLLLDVKRQQPSLAGIEVYALNGTLRAAAGEPIGLPPPALSSSYHRPIVNDSGWQWYDAYAPIFDELSARVGVIALRYDATQFLLSPLAIASGLGQGSAVQFGFFENDRVRVLRPDRDARRSTQVLLGDNDTDRKTIPIVGAVHGDEVMGRFVDERGTEVLAAARALPFLGWGLSVQMEYGAAVQQVNALAASQGLLGVLLILLALALAYLLAEQLTSPLRQLTSRVRQLRPGNWQLDRTVHTGDEVEVLDQVITDLALRLQAVYDHQEEEIDKRTAELKQQYALDRGILEGIDQGVITVDNKGVINGANPAAVKLLELDAAQMIGQSGAAILNLRVHDGTVLKGQHPISTCLEKKKPMHSPPNARWNVMRKDETLLPILLTVSPLMQGNSLFGAIIVLQDFTEERRLDYLKSEFITLASHQLRTPLSAVRWYVELFQEDKKSLDETQQSYLQEMDMGLKRMAGLLNDLLHAAHLEDDALQPDMQPVDATQVVHELFKDGESLAKKFNLSFYQRAPNKKVMLETDPTLIRIILQNMISNAMKYSRKGKSVTIHLEEDAKKVTFSVQDEGVGIPAKDQDRVFQRFFRAKNVRQMDTDGNGLGLYITKAIVERLGGMINFKSKENVGTTFTVTFPMGNISTKKKSA